MIKLIEEIAGELVAKASRKDKPLRVGIDGMSCAGKTTFADRLGEVIRTRSDYRILRPSVDGFHRPRSERYRQGEYSAKGYYEDTFDYDAIRARLLEPLNGDTFPVRCLQASFDYRVDRPAEEAVEVPRRTILLFEGVSLFRPELDSWWDERILLKISFETAIIRALKRDQELLGSAQNILAKYERRYNPAWEIYERLANPEAKADIVIDNERPDRPRRIAA